MSSGPTPPPPSGGGKPGPRGKPHGGGKGGGNANVYVNPFSKGHVVPERIDMGVDYSMNDGDPILAVGKSTVDCIQSDWSGYGPYISLRFLEGPFAGLYWYVAESLNPAVRSGQTVEAGQVVARFITGGSGNEMGWGTSTCGSPLGASQVNGADHNNTAAGHDWADFMTKLGQGGWTSSTPIKGDLNAMPFHKNGGDITGPGSPGGSGGAGGSSGQDPEAIAKAAAISTYLEFPSLLVSEESIALTGQRSLLNDQQLLPFIEQLCQGALRNFQSMPNGHFFAFFPDYFGGLSHRTPYWEIRDIEIIEGKIDLSDDALATHVYVVGDTGVFDGQVDIQDEIRTAGVITVFNAFMADFLNGVDSPVLQREFNKKGGGKDAQKQAEKEYQKKIDKIPTLAQKERALAFLKKYGARPWFEPAPMVRSPFFEKFLAYQKFCLLWSKQFLTTFEFTFMPELFPGGIVSFPDHGIQCYIDEVVHECDYETGFVTRANLSSPSAIDRSKKDNARIHEGLIRSWVYFLDPHGKDNGPGPGNKGGS